MIRSHPTPHKEVSLMMYQNKDETKICCTLTCQ